MDPKRLTPPDAVTPSALDVLFKAAIDAGLAHELPWWRVEDILDHIGQVDWLADHDHPTPLPVPTMPAEPPAELLARRRAIAAEWAAVSARANVDAPPEPQERAGGLSPADRTLIRELHDRRATELEAEAC